MSLYTRLGAGIWDWAPFVGLTAGARCMYLALYTSPAAKRLVPGLFHGGYATMADAAKMSAHDAIEALRELFDRELAEMDPATGVTRLVSLPDLGERAFNGRMIHGWWNRFQTIPQCRVRDAHLPIIAALCEPIEKERAIAWTATFATLEPIRGKKRAVHRLSTGSVNQLELGELSTGKVLPVDNPVDNSIDLSTGSKPDIDHLETYPQCHTEHLYGMRYRFETVCDTVRSLYPESGDPDLRTPEQQDLGLTCQSQVDPGSAHPAQVAQPAPMAPPRSPVPFTVREMVSVLEARSCGIVGATYDHRLHDALTATAAQIAAGGLGLPEVGLVGDWLAAGALAFRDDLGPTWASRPGNLLDAIGAARRWVDSGRPNLGKQGSPVRSHATPAPSRATVDSPGSGSGPGPTPTGRRHL